MNPTLKITRAEIAECILPLEQPIFLGSVRVDTRDYVCLRLSTNAGIEGFAIGYKSGSQLLDGLKLLAPQLIGQDPLMRQRVNFDGENARVPARASYVRALSLIDIALWDITAKAAQLPLYVLLGGFRKEVTAMPVVGFSYADRPREQIEHEIDTHLAAGERLIKVMIKGFNAIENSQYLRAICSRMQDGAALAVDAHWSWRSITDALQTCRRIDDIGLAFIEDPFLPQQWRLVGELRSKLGTPIAVGEDVLDPYGYADLVQNVDILRVDATGSGGITAAMSALSLATAAGRVSIPHVFPYLHLHLACASRAISAVEYIPEHTGTDPVRLLLRSFPPIRDGKFLVSEEPGAGCDLNWEAVSKSAGTALTF